MAKSQSLSYIRKGVDEALWRSWLFMWSVVCVFLVVYGIFRAWVRSRLAWMDFLILRGSFLYCRLLHRWSTNSPCPFPLTGPALIVCNHTCSADPTFLLAAVDRTFSVLLANEHFDLHPVTHAVLKHLRCVPVVRTGPDPVALRRALDRLAAGHLLCLFPEGNLSGIGLNRVRRAKHGVAYLALVSRVPVYPVYIAGGPRTDQLLKSWLMPTTRAVHVVFGKPVSLAHFYERPRTRQVIEEVTDFLMAQVTSLNPKRDCRGQSAGRTNALPRNAAFGLE